MRNLHRVCRAWFDCRAKKNPSKQKFRWPKKKWAFFRFLKDMRHNWKGGKLRLPISTHAVSSKSQTSVFHPQGGGDIWQTGDNAQTRGGAVKWLNSCSWGLSIPPPNSVHDYLQKKIQKNPSWLLKFETGAGMKKITPTTSDETGRAQYALSKKWHKNKHAMKTKKSKKNMWNLSSPINLQKAKEDFLMMNSFLDKVQKSKKKHKKAKFFGQNKKKPGEPTKKAFAS